MKIHELKTDLVPFDNVWHGRKTFEVRKDDRKYENGDILHLRETYNDGEAMREGAPLDYTGREVLAKVLHKMKGKYGIKQGWCILSIQKLEQSGSF